MKLTLTGNIPSKKNSRINTRTGKSFPSVDYQRWQNDAIWQVVAQKIQWFREPVRLDVVLFFGKRGRADMDNKLSSILDMLVKAEVLLDDSWEYVPEISLKAVYRKGEAGAEVEFTPVEKP